MPAQFLPAPERWVLLYLIARGGQSEFVRHESLRMWLAGDVYLLMNIMEVSRIWLDPFQALLGYSGLHCQFGPQGGMQSFARSPVTEDPDTNSDSFGGNQGMRQC
jgi:hypothetical protein